MEAITKLKNKIPKNLTLPRQEDDGRYYISYSQYSKWKDKPQDYIRSYFLGDRFDGNAYTEFGTKVGEALENDKYKGFSKKEKKTLKKATRLDEFERRIELDFGPFFVLGFIDTNNKKGTKLIDYKTGAMDKVAVYEADSYDQLAIYAAAMWQETGVQPKTAHVELIKRFGNPHKSEPLLVGKKVAKIEKDISPERIDKVCEDILKSAKDISYHFKVFNAMKKILV